MSKIKQPTHAPSRKVSHAKSHAGHGAKAHASAKSDAQASVKGWGPSGTTKAKKHHLMRDAAMAAGIALLLKHTVLKGDKLSVQNGGMSHSLFGNTLKSIFGLGAGPGLTGDSSFDLAGTHHGIAQHAIDMFRNVYRSAKLAVTGNDNILNEAYLPPKPQFPGANATDQQLLQYQEAMQKYNRMLTMITQILEMQHEGKKAVQQNLRA